MIKRIQFKNFKALKDTAVSLGPFNVIIGPNGSGKSTVLEALEMFSGRRPQLMRAAVNFSATREPCGFEVELSVGSRIQRRRLVQTADERWDPYSEPGAELQGMEQIRFDEDVRSIRVYALEPSRLCQPAKQEATVELARDGGNLSAALSYLRDRDEDAYHRLRAELHQWMPEFDAVGFKTWTDGARSFELRHAKSKTLVPANCLSEGTLLAVALLTIVHQPIQPMVIGLEEPDRGLHPRRLREVLDALYRLSFPKDFGLDRPPVQVVVSTHSPVFLDLLKGHPEQIIVAEKHADGTATLKNLGDDPKLIEILGDTPFGDAWYTGILGGVAAAA